jgi:hypothetical protein
MSPSNGTVLLIMLSAAALQACGDSGKPMPSIDPHPQPAQRASYQQAISRALPGYRILRNEDFVQDENLLRNFLPPPRLAERAQRKALGLVAGWFNNDTYPDFAALVVNRAQKMSRPPELRADRNPGEYYAARLVVCLGTAAPQQYHCEVLPTLQGNFISLPYGAELEVVQSPGAAACGDSRRRNEDDAEVTAIYPERWHGQAAAAGDAPPSHADYDAIAEHALGSNLSRLLVRQPDAVYLDCAGFE